VPRTELITPSTESAKNASFKPSGCSPRTRQECCVLEKISTNNVQRGQSVRDSRVFDLDVGAVGLGILQADVKQQSHSKSHMNVDAKHVEVLEGVFDEVGDEQLPGLLLCRSTETDCVASVSHTESNLSEWASRDRTNKIASEQTLHRTKQ